MVAMHEAFGLTAPGRRMYSAKSKRCRLSAGKRGAFRKAFHQEQARHLFAGLVAQTGQISLAFGQRQRPEIDIVLE